MQNETPPYLWRLCVNQSAAVKEAVDAQGGAASEPFATVLTDVRLFSGVQDQMLLEISLQAVGLLTVRTRKRTLAAVTQLEIIAVLFAIIYIITSAIVISHWGGLIATLHDD